MYRTSSPTERDFECFEDMLAFGVENPEAVLEEYIDDRIDPSNSRWRRVGSPQLLEARIAHAKSQILLDIQSGLVPKTVVRFAQLHDYVDANGYGGAFEDGAPDANDEFWDDLQNAVDAWLRGGRK